MLLTETAYTPRAWTNLTRRVKDGNRNDIVIIMNEWKMFYVNLVVAVVAIRSYNGGIGDNVAVDNPVSGAKNKPIVIPPPAYTHL